MRRFLLVTVLLFTLIINPVQAQASQSIDQMVIKIWPEYDQPSVLVIMDFFLAADAKLPANVSIRIPAAVGQPHSVAVRELDGQLYVLDYQSQISGDWNTLTFTTPYAEVWVEYYDPSINKVGNQRSYEFLWAGDMAVNTFSLEVQQPSTAENMTFKEIMATAQHGADGLTYYTSEVGSLAAGTSFSLNIEYTKRDDVLSSANSLPVQPSAPLTNTTTGRQPMAGWLPYLLGGLGMLLVLLGLFWYFQSKRNPLLAISGNKPVARKRHTSVSYNQETIYCHQCGKRADAGDVFCRACGTKLKLE